MLSTGSVVNLGGIEEQRPELEEAELVANYGRQLAAARL